jgi:4-oxalmesaconate hydratase
MIIDCHGHYTTAPEPRNIWREPQKAAFTAGEAALPCPAISGEEIRETIEANQLHECDGIGGDVIGAGRVHRRIAADLERQDGLS